jgi:hypothetical protein
MNTKFNETIVETNGVRTVAGGGTGAATAPGALTALGAATAAQGAKADGAVQKTGDTMTGQLTMDANVQLLPSRTIHAGDPADLEATNTQIAHDGINLYNGAGISFGGIGDAVARANLRSQIGAEPTITTLPISRGGTGATTAEQARTNLGAAPSLAYSLINVWPRPNSLPNGDSDVVSANSGVSRFIECFPQQADDNLYYKLKIPAAWRQASGDVLKILFKTDEPNRPLLLTVLAEIAPGDPGESPITGAVGSIRQGESLTLFRPPVVSEGEYSHDWIVESDNHTHQVFTPTTLVPGTAGFVPAPLDGDQNKFLKSNGTWATVPAALVSSVAGKTGVVTLTLADVPNAVGSVTTGIPNTAPITNMMQITSGEYNNVTPAANTLYIIVG